MQKLVNLLIIMLLLGACGNTQGKDETVMITQAGTLADKDTDEPVAPTDNADADVVATVAAAGTDLPPTTDTPYPTFTPYPTDTPSPTQTPLATQTATEAVTQTATEVVVATSVPVAASDAAPAQATSANAVTASTTGLTRIEDTDPAPPITILVSTIQIVENGNYKMTGLVRNDSTEIYGGIGVIATFYEEATPCTEYEVTRPRRDGGQETVVVVDCDYNWHGPVEVYAACRYLEPGATCPFSLEIYPRDYVSYLLHPEGSPVEYRQPVFLTLQDVNAANNGLGVVRMTGTILNEHPFTVQNPQVMGTLLDAAGQIVSVGSIAVPGEVAPGASVTFDLRIEYQPYTDYQLSVQAIQD